MQNPRSGEKPFTRKQGVALESSCSATASRLVWDVPVRVMHWLLVLAFAGAWLSHYELPDWFSFHAICGYIILVVAITRVIWGMVGTYHARFTNFVRGPRFVIRYLRGIGSVRSTVGHNPVGALMVVLILALLIAQSVTGLFANDQVTSVGPMFGYISAATSDKLTGIHKLLANVILTCLCLHIVAVLAHYLLKRENLILPMVTGRKLAQAVPQELAIANSRTWIAVAIATVVIILLTIVIYTAPEASLGFP